MKGHNWRNVRGWWVWCGQRCRDEHDQCAHRHSESWLGRGGIPSELDWIVMIEANNKMGVWVGTMRPEEEVIKGSQRLSFLIDEWRKSYWRKLINSLALERVIHLPMMVPKLPGLSPGQGNYHGYANNSNKWHSNSYFNPESLLV